MFPELFDQGMAKMIGRNDIFRFGDFSARNMDGQRVVRFFLFLGQSGSFDFKFIVLEKSRKRKRIAGHSRTIYVKILLRRKPESFTVAVLSG